MTKKKKIRKKGIPEKFLERLHTMLGPALSTQVEKTFVERPVTFRVNTIRSNKKEVRDALHTAGFKTTYVPWYPDAFVLRNKTKRALMELPIYAEGKIYIQSLASMVPPILLEPQPGDRVLDLTAAPGSKTSQIAAHMGLQGELVANDSNKVRFFKLKHNMELLGVVDERPDWSFSLRLEYGSKLCQEYEGYFDKILLDAPCTAEARFVQGKAKTYAYWSERKIKEMAYKQRKLLFSALSALRFGGTLVYSTCTMAPEENEVQMHRILEKYGDVVEVVPIKLAGLKRAASIKIWKNKQMHAGVEHTLRILPTAEIEGFFVAKMKKK